MSLSLVQVYLNLSLLGKYQNTSIVVLGSLTILLNGSALARAGKKVLHIDSSELYGGNWSVYDIKNMLKWVEHCSSHASGKKIHLLHSQWFLPFIFQSIPSTMTVKQPSNTRPTIYPTIAMSQFMLEKINKRKKYQLKTWTRRYHPNSLIQSLQMHHPSKHSPKCSKSHVLTTWIWLQNYCPARVNWWKCWSVVVWVVILNSKVWMRCVSSKMASLKG